MNQAWGEVQKLFGNGFTFLKTYVYKGGNELCVGLINSVKSTDLSSTYEQCIKKYILELESLALFDKSTVKSMIDARNAPMVTWLSSNLDPNEFESSHPYKIDLRAVDSTEGGEVIYAEIHQPSCTGAMIKSYSEYFTFLNQVLLVHQEFLERLGLIKKPRGFKVADGRADIKSCYQLLVDSGLVKCEYKHFKNVFSGKGSDKINWISSVAALKYFIKSLTGIGKMKVSKKWITAIEFFNLDGKAISKAAELSGAQDLIDKKVIKQLNQAIEFLFPMSH